MQELSLKEAFGAILSYENLSEHMCAITELIYSNELDRKGLHSILQEFKIGDLKKIKIEVLDLILMYIVAILKDFHISETEQKNISLLKRFFKIKEGDFFRYRHKEIKTIIINHVENIYADGNVDSGEAIYKVNLQGLFDLSYDQFLQLTEDKITNALKLGAQINNLDTIRYPQGYK